MKFSLIRLATIAATLGFIGASAAATTQNAVDTQKDITIMQQALPNQTFGAASVPSGNQGAPQQTAAVGAKAGYDIPILKFVLARAASPGVNKYRVAKIRLGVSEMMVGMAGKTKYGLGVQTFAKPGGSYIANGTYVARVTPQSGTLFALSAAPKVTNAA